MNRALRTLHVWVNQRRVGVLREVPSGVAGRAPDIEFEYLAGVAKEDQVSLTLPVNAGVMRSGALPACFGQNLPEGERYLAAIKLGKIARVDDDFSMCALTGQNTVGRVAVTLDAETPPDRLGDVPVLPIDVTGGGRDYFMSLYERVGYRHGISGMEHKILADSGELPGSLRASHFVVKSFDPQKGMPALNRNEFYTTRVARMAGLPVCNQEISDDGGLLYVKRFDINPEGGFYGFEEAGTLLNRNSREKYEGSYAGLFAVMRDRLDPSVIRKSSEAFFGALVLNTMVRNGEAHGKDFGVLYEDASKVRLAPFYDLVTTGAYVANEVPALLLDDESSDKTWASEEALLNFARRHLMLPKTTAAEIVDRVGMGVGRGMLLLARGLKDMKSEDLEGADTDFELVGDSMLKVWAEGLTELRPQLADEYQEKVEAMPDHKLPDQLSPSFL